MSEAVKTDEGRWFGFAWVTYRAPVAVGFLNYGGWGLTKKKASKRCIAKIKRDQNLDNVWDDA